MGFVNRLKALAILPLMAAKSPKSKVGGQAIIEGVMMRGKQNVSWAVRTPDGEIAIEKMEFISFARRHRKWAVPIVRGAVNLYESLVLGYRALSRSAEIITAAEDAQKNGLNGSKEAAKSKKNGFMDKLYASLSFGVAMIVSVGLFMYAPMWLISRILPDDSVVAFNTLAGAIRIVLFLLYLIIISQWKEIRRVFEYHGAEHKAIFAFEDGKELSPENMQAYSTVHPRCGTSFLLIVAAFCILLFSVVDAIIIGFIGPYTNVAARLMSHLLLIPVVAGSSYEILKWSDRHKRIPLVGMLIKPGLWLQKITTREPDAQQLIVASTALKAVV